MNEYVFLVPVAVALIAGVVSPGPSFLLLAQTAMGNSRCQGISTALGLGTGSVIFALLASFGLFIVLETVPWLYIILKLVGGLYLCYLAYKIWVSANQPLAVDGQLNQELSVYKSFSLGLFTQLSNPKTAIVFGGVFMAFLPSEIPDYSHLLLAIMTFIIDAGWYTLVAIALTTTRAKGFYLRFKKHINWAASGVMAFMGTKLAFNQ